MKMKHVIIAAFIINLAVATGFAASKTVEIFYLPHPPAEAVVRDVEAILRKHSEFKVVKYNFEDPKSRDQMKKYNIRDHKPIAIYINGKNDFVMGQRKVIFENFQKGNNFAPMFQGNWTYQDFENVLQTASRGK
jgi:hypothetical protein